MQVYRKLRQWATSDCHCEQLGFLDMLVDTGEAPQEYVSRLLQDTQPEDIKPRIVALLLRKCEGTGDAPLGTDLLELLVEKIRSDPSVKPLWGFPPWVVHPLT